MSSFTSSASFIPILNAKRDQSVIEQRIARRRNLFDPHEIAGVAGIFDQVRALGDEAVLAATRVHDGVSLETCRVSDQDAKLAAASIPAPLRSAIDLSIARIRRVNDWLLLPAERSCSLDPGARIGELNRPLDSVALWIPCRKGPLVSTALMLVTAARAAGVPRIVALMPPSADGRADSGTLGAAKIAGANAFYVGNGVALIAAAAIGTPALPSVAGVFGPGPGGIALAMALAGAYGVRSVAGIGPTDCAVLADETADARAVAWDLASEAEHGPDSASLLVTTSADLATTVVEELGTILDSTPESRARNVRSVFGETGRGMLVTASSFEEACGLVSSFAPEHLSIVCAPDREQRALECCTAGEILLGRDTPFAAANYVIGITAVLPTNGRARSISGVTARDMQRTATVARLDHSALLELQPAIMELALYEGLPCHARAAGVRGDFEFTR